MRALFISLAFLCTLGSTGSAQVWPTRAVTFVVPLPAGGIVDVMGRPMLQKLQERWGQPTVLDNKGGATGTIGANFVARAEPDGHTLLYTVDLPITMAPNLMKVPYDPVNDFELIATFAETEQLLVVHPSLGVKSFDALIAKMKAEPGKLTYASGGVASPAHICMEGIAQAANAKLVHVPYRGAAPAMNGLLAGEVDIFCGPLAQSLPQVESGLIVGIATSGLKRAVLTPNLPTLIESGLKDFSFIAQYYLLAPKGTPAAVQSQIRGSFKAVLDEPDIRDRLAKMAIYPKWLEGEQGKAEIRKDLARWGEIIRKGNIKAE